MDWHLGCFFGMLIWGINLEFNHTDKPRRVGYITGADMMIRKEIINQVGGFSKYFFMYYEECELTYRIRKQGYDVFSVPAARIQHLEGKSFPSSELTTKTKYQTYSRLMYHRLCSPIVYRLLALYAKLCSKMPVQKSAYLDYKVNVFRQIDRNVK
jgi:GT2 family glycosyltransferase